MIFSRGQTETKVRCESRLFSQGKTPQFTEMGEIHELFVLALALVWFAGATPDIKCCFVAPPSVRNLLGYVLSIFLKSSLRLLEDLVSSTRSY